MFYSARMTFISWIIIEQLMLIASIIFGYSYIEVTLPVIGSTGVIFSILMNRFVVFRKFRYRDLIRTVIYNVLRFAVYSMWICLFKYSMPFIPLFISFNAIVVLLIPAEYLVHKWLYLSKYNDIVKDR